MIVIGVAQAVADGGRRRRGRVRAGGADGRCCAGVARLVGVARARAAVGARGLPAADPRARADAPGGGRAAGAGATEADGAATSCRPYARQVADSRAGSARDERSRRSFAPEAATEDPDLQVLTGATGLEPATSGVTGRVGHRDVSRRIPPNARICRYFSR